MAILVYFLWLLLAVALQVLLFSHLSLFGGVILVYLIALIKMPIELNRNYQIITGFIVGLVIDIFCNTPGMNALAAVTVMAVRNNILHLFNNDPEFKSGAIDNSRIGLTSYMRFAATAIVFHCLLLYIIESFTLFNITILLSRILISSLLTFVTAMILEFATMKK